jgi:hypothetical protein
MHAFSSGVSAVARNIPSFPHSIIAFSYVCWGQL